jgi:pyruvate,water dikinase
MPAAVQEEIARAYGELGGHSSDAAAAVAVRSSAIGEDSESATFAGQQQTFLWVAGAHNVIDAVRDCWASLYSPTAVSYRARAASADRGPASVALGASGASGATGPPAMGVAVQVMVDALVSGVMFTCNPVSGDPSMVAINASWGLGLAVVGGEVTPDDYLVSKVTGEIVREHVGSKQVQYVADPGGGTVRVDVTPERRGLRCLDEPALRELVELGRRVQRHFGSHQDIEWAIARDQAEANGLFVVQSRPVTAAPKRKPTAPAASALSLVMSTFGADRRPADEDRG